MMAYMRRPGFQNGAMVPPQKPEQKTPFIDKLKNLKEVAPGLMPRSKVSILKMYMDEALRDGEITQEQHTEMLMPYFGELGENVTEQIAVSDRDNFAIGGGVIEGEDLGTREGFAEAKFNDPSAGIKVGDDLGNGISQQRIKKDGSVVYRVYKGKVKGKQLESRGITSYEDAVAEREKYVPFKKGATLSKEQIKNENKWKKANPNLNYDDLSDTLKSNIRKTGRTDLGTIGQGKANLFLTGEDSPFYKPLDEEGKKIAEQVYGTTDITDDQRLRINRGETTIETKPVKFEKGKDISLKMKRGSEEVTDIVFPNKQVEKDFIKAIRARVLQPQKAVVDFTNKELSELFPISEKQAGRAARFLINKLGLKYQEVPTKTSAEIIKKTRNSLAKTSSVLQEDRIRMAKTPILKEKNLSKKIDIAHRVSKKQMERLGLEFSTDTMGIDSRLINQIIVKPSEIKLNRLYTKQFNAFEKLKKNPNSTEAIKELENINKQVKDIVKSTSGRLVGISIDPKTLEPSFVGIKKKYSFSNVLGKSMTMKELEKLPEEEQRKFLNKQLPKAIDIEVKRGFVPNDFKNILTNKESQKSILKYTKKNAPELLGSIKKAIANPESRVARQVFSIAPQLIVPGAIGFIGYKGLGFDTPVKADDQLPFPGIKPEGSPGQINIPKEVLENYEPGAFDPERAEPSLALTAAAAPLATQKGRNLYGKFAKQIARGTKNIGKGLLKTVGSPLVASGFAGSEIFESINPFNKEGEFLKLKEDPNLGMAGAELLLPDIAKRTLGETAKRKGILGLAKRVALNPYFKLARGFTPVGATLLGAEGIKKLYDEEQKKNRMIEAMDPEEKLQFLEEEKATEEFMSRQSAAYGGRMGFADGPKDPKRRNFMKIMSGIASIPLLGRFIDIGTQAPKVAEVLRRGADGIPDFLNDLVTKVITFGKKSFSGGRSDELEEVYQLDNYVVTKKGDKTTIREVDQDGDMLYKENQMEIEIDPETGGVTYNEASAKPDMEGKLKDVEEYIEESDLENMRKYTYDE